MADVRPGCLRSFIRLEIMSNVCRRPRDDRADTRRVAVLTTQVSGFAPPESTSHRFAPDSLVIVCFFSCATGRVFTSRAPPGPERRTTRQTGAELRDRL